MSSLPMLHFGSPAPFSFEKFIQICQGLIPAEHAEVLKKIKEGVGSLDKDKQSTLKKWHDFEVTLRNELVRIRASKKHIDPHKYLRQSDSSEPYVSRMALAASRNPSIVEAEMILDQARWQMLEELSLGHYFDFDILIIYGLKLLILERWDKVKTTDKSRILEEALTKA